MVRIYNGLEVGDVVRLTIFALCVRHKVLQRAQCRQLHCQRSLVEEVTADTEWRRVVLDEIDSLALCHPGHLASMWRCRDRCVLTVYGDGARVSGLTSEHPPRQAHDVHVDDLQHVMV